MGYMLVPFPSEADLYIINTCTVTSKSEHHSRNAVRKAIRVNPKGIVVVTGCAAQVNPEAFALIPGVNLVIGNEEKAQIRFFIDSFKKGGSVRISITDWSEKPLPIFPMAINRFIDYTRAFIKIQEGCDAHCTYCIVPKARGPARSAGMEDIISQVQDLWGAGYKEIVLTGIHLGQYGNDMRPKRHLYELLKQLLSDNGLNRLRLSSIEPNEFTPQLLRVIGTSSRLCPHFHVPLQSGSRSVLARMGRQYSPRDYSEVIYNILDKNPIASIGADVIVGFPGESEEDFEMTYLLLERLPLAYLHVFNYSPRPGTTAALLPNQLDGFVKKSRSQHLRRLGQKKKEAFRSRFLGKELEGLVLNQTGPKTGYKVALTGNYIPVFVEAGMDLVNHMVIVKALKLTKNGIWGNVTSVLN
jgi:threonylcarbamoyladenosine tRNA methylthiotransferase MtaB